MRAIIFEQGGRLDLGSQLELQEVCRMLCLQKKGRATGAGRLYAAWRANLERVLLAAEARLMAKACDARKAGGLATLMVADAASGT